MYPGAILSDYIEHAMEQAEYDKLEDGTYGGSIPPVQECWRSEVH